MLFPKNEYGERLAKQVTYEHALRNPTRSISNMRDKPITQYTSVGTWRQPDSKGISFDSSTNRFARPKIATRFADSTANPSSFKANNPNHVPKVPKQEELPEGRPLWTLELSKEVPPGTNYELEQAIGSKKLNFKSRAPSFSNTFERYRRTCDIQKGIKVFN